MGLILGIDPGLTGAIAMVADAPWHNAIWDLPTRVDPEVGRRIDGAALAQLLTKNLPAGESLQVVIEAMAHGGIDEHRTRAAVVDSQTWTQSAIVTTFEILGVAIAGYVYAPTWKKLYGLGGKAAKDATLTKRRVREVAVQLYPELVDMLQRQQDHNRAEALLIAHWWLKVRA